MSVSRCSMREGGGERLREELTPPPAAAVIGEPLSPAEPQGVKGRDEKTGRRIVWVEVSGGRWTEWEEEVSLD